MNTDELLNRYQHGYQKLCDLLKEIPDEAIYYRPDDKSWSIIEVIVHLGDAEAYGFVRSKKIIAECGGKVAEYHRQIWADNLFYYDMNYRDALEMIRILRKNLFDVLKRIKPEAWHQYIYHPESGKITLIDWIQLNVDHIDIHLNQIKCIYNKWKKSQEELPVAATDYHDGFKQVRLDKLKDIFFRYLVW